MFSSPIPTEVRFGWQPALPYPSYPRHLSRRSLGIGGSAIVRNSETFRVTHRKILRSTSVNG